MRTAIEYRMASKEQYRLWKLEFPDSDLTYYEWSSIIYNFNYAVRDHILETGEIFKLSWGFGELSILKKGRKREIELPDGSKRINMPIDWVKSKKAGKKIYNFNFHTDGFSFKWKWFPRTARFRYSRLWVFKPSRLSSRMLKYYLTKEGHYFKYREWDIIPA